MILPVFKNNLEHRKYENIHKLRYERIQKKVPKLFSMIEYYETESAIQR